jgi:hypothetical protein
VIGVASVMTTFSGSLKPELYSTARAGAHETASSPSFGHRRRTLASPRHRHSAGAFRADADFSLVLV